ncbi:MAG: hypothetical protein GY940_25500 [bacterium]|nr:hypothetical protein [bacterium]
MKAKLFQTRGRKILLSFLFLIISIGFSSNLLADITISTGDSFPLASHAKIDKWITVGNITGTRYLTYNISTASDPYARYFYMYVNDVKVLTRIVAGSASGSVNVSNYITGAGSYKITYEVYYGGYRVWNLNSSVLQGASAADISLVGDTLIIVGPDNNTVRLRGNWEEQQGGGYTVYGQVILETPLGDVPFSVTQMDATSDPLNLSGTVSSFPYPKFNFFDQLTGNTPNMTIGIAAGAQLEDEVDIDLQTGRLYLYFISDEGFAFDFEAANIEASSSGAGGTTIVLDPFDPMIYLDGDIFGIGDCLEKKGISDLGLGASLQGMIPFTADHPVWDGSALNPYTFNGHLFVKGSVQLGQYPLNVSGSIVADADIDNNGYYPFFDNSLTDVKLGANGTLAVGYEYAGFDITLDVAGGSAVYDSSKSKLMFNAEQLQNDILGIFQPSGTQNVQVYGYFSHSGSVYIKASGEYAVGGFTLGSGVIELDNSGIDVSGTVGIHNSSINVSGTVSTNGNFTLQSAANINIPLSGGTLKGQVELKKTGSTITLGGYGYINFAGTNFYANFTVSTSGKVSFSAGVNVGPYSLKAGSYTLGSLSGNVSLSVSNNVVSASFSGTASIFNGFGSFTVGGSVDSSGNICFTLPISIPYTCGWWVCWKSTFCVDVL